MVHEHNTSLFEIEQLWKVIRKILVKVLMSFSFHEDLHRGQNLSDTMSVMVCALLLTDLFELKYETIHH